jgi:ArsR family transcriptional regulator, lead/cadmium/zinc/bismuth-responsive transcriptional repressor
VTHLAYLDMPAGLDDQDSEGVAQAKANLVDGETAYEVAQLFKALSDPTRVRLISILAKNELCVHSIVEVLGMTQSAISHQLQTLRVMRVVRSRKEGKHVYYTLDDTHIADLFRQGLAHIRHG